MALVTSGAISIGGTTAGRSINLELGRAATATSNLNEAALRTLAGKASGAISLADFYGKANAVHPDGVFVYDDTHRWVYDEYDQVLTINWNNVVVYNSYLTEDPVTITVAGYKYTRGDLMSQLSDIFYYKIKREAV